MAKDCAFCEISRLLVASCAVACFTALIVLSLASGITVPIWVLIGFVVSSVVAILVIGAYFRERRVGHSEADAKHGAKG